MSATFENELHEYELEDELAGFGEFESHEMHEQHEFEFEDEFAGEFELEGSSGEFETEISPVRKIYPDAMMEHLAHLAAEAESEQEAAEHFLPLVGLAAKKLLPIVARAVAPKLARALPRMARVVTRVEPGLTKAVTRIARGLYRRPEMRPMLRAMPLVARQTVGSIARQAARGVHITPRSAIRTLANQTRRVLLRPSHRLHAIRRSRLMDGRLHRYLPGVIRPHGRPGYAYGPGRVLPRAAYLTNPVTPGAAGRCNCQALHCRCCGQVVR